MTVDVQRKPTPLNPLNVLGCLVSRVESYKFLSVRNFPRCPPMTSREYLILYKEYLIFKVDLISTIKKTQQSNLSQELLRSFYFVIIQSTCLTASLWGLFLQLRQTGNQLFQLLPYSRRYRSMYASTTRYKKSSFFNLL